MSRGFQRRPEDRIDAASGTSVATPKPHTRLKYSPALVGLIRGSLDAQLDERPERPRGRR